MKHLFLLLLFSSIFILTLEAKEISLLAKELNLYGGTKATVQWERVFSSKRHLIRYGLESIPKDTRDRLKVYLIDHSADSQQPIVPGL